MSTRNEALRSVHVRTIFVVIVAAFFPHSGSTLRRPAISSKNALVKYCTIGRCSRGPEVGPQEKGSDGASPKRPRRERFYGPRSLRGRAWVAKPGQRRGTQDPFPKGFPGSNPGPRIEFAAFHAWVVPRLTAPACMTQ